jgi:hypothetical protein
MLCMHQTWDEVRILPTSSWAKKAGRRSRDLMNKSAVVESKSASVKTSPVLLKSKL